MQTSEADPMAFQHYKHDTFKPNVCTYSTLLNSNMIDELSHEAFRVDADLQARIIVLTMPTYGRLAHRPPLYGIPIYHPLGRYIREMSGEDTGDWYTRNCVPHEVSFPDPELPWRTFKRWMLDVARSWRRVVPGCDGLVSFFAVVKNRIDRQRAHCL